MQNHILIDNQTKAQVITHDHTQDENIKPSQYLDLAEQLINHQDLVGARNYLSICETTTLTPSEALKLLALKKRI